MPIVFCLYRLFEFSLLWHGSLETLKCSGIMLVNQAFLDIDVSEYVVTLNIPLKGGVVMDKLDN